MWNLKVAVYQQTIVYTGDLFTGMNFDPMHMSVKTLLLMKNVDF